jgi:hypothetical protein
MCTKHNKENVITNKILQLQKHYMCQLVITKCKVIAIDQHDVIAKHDHKNFITNKLL